MKQMWEYNKTIYSDELYHYGVLGMKWGRRKGSAGKTIVNKKSKKQVPLNKKLGKAIGNQVKKKIEKNKKRDEQIKKTTDWFGVGGVAIGSAIRAGRNFTAKKTMAHFINGAANAYISSGKGSYAVNRGVDFVRKAAINGLSASVYADQIRGARDIAKSYNYSRSKNK